MTTSQPGSKPSKIRFDDRGYVVGDVLTLERTNHTGAEMAAGAPLEYTGRRLDVCIQRKRTGYGLMPGWCVLSIRVLEPA